MRRPFDLEWLEGPAEAYFRRLRPGVDDLPWGTLDPRDYPEELVDRARVSWTEGAYNEYCSAAAFAALLAALLEAGAPVDLVGMAGEFVADEMLHTELNARVAMELGGGAPYLVDFERLAPRPGAGLGPLQRAAELAVRVSCVGEAFSLPMLVGSMRAAAHPLTRAVLQRIARDEVPHARVGWLFLDWAGPLLDDAERARLAGVALDALRDQEPYWKQVRSRAVGGVTSEGFQLRHVRQLGWMEAGEYAAEARRAVREEIVAPLARAGIELPSAEVSSLLA